MNLGTAIKETREAARMTLDDIADVTGSTKANLSRIEGGQWPRPELLESIAKALGVKVYQLFARAENVSLPVTDETGGEREIIGAYRLMEPEAKYHLKAVAAALSAHKE